MKPNLRKTPYGKTVKRKVVAPSPLSTPRYSWVQLPREEVKKAYSKGVSEVRSLIKSVLNSKDPSGLINKSFFFSVRQDWLRDGNCLFRLDPMFHTIKMIGRKSSGDFLPLKTEMDFSPTTS